MIRNEKRLLKSLEIPPGSKTKRFLLPPFVPTVFRTNFTLLLYGKLVEAQDGAEVVYKIEPAYIVKHRPIALTESQNYGQRFRKYLESQRWTFPISREMEALKIVPDNIRQHVLYATGMSAHFSQRFDTALQLHTDLLSIIKPRVPREPYLRTLQAQLHSVIALEAQMLGNFYYYNEKKSEEAEKYYLLSLKYKSNDYTTHINLASLYYLKDPIGKTFQKKVYFHLGEAKKTPMDASFKLSKAFLMIFWDGKVEEGFDHYLQTLKTGAIPLETAQGTSEWLSKRLEKETEENQLLITALISLLQFFKLDKKMGTDNLQRVIANLIATSSHTNLAKKLSKLI